jgi:MFS family permease
MTALQITPASLSPTARCILAARFWRSIAQGALVVDLALYLNALHWSGAAIGAVFSGAAIAGAVFGLITGSVTDRFGRKQFLLAYEVLCCVCGLVAFFTSNTAMLTAVIVLAGFGRGANGAAGPFAPAEDAWLAETVEPIARGFVFSLKSAIGFIGMAIGALTAMLPALWTATLGPAGSYRPLFLIVVLGNAANVFILWRAPNQAQTPAWKGNGEPSQPPKEIHGRENQFLWRLMALNVFNGFTVGLTTPLMSYWFEQRFHVGPALIAPVMAATFIAVAVIAVFSGGLARRAGLVNVFVWARGSGVVLLVLLPIMPVYALAALLHIVRSSLTFGTIGVRQALVISAVHDKRRGLVSSLNTFSERIPQSIGPTVAGSLIGAGWFVTPFYLAAIFQGAYLLLFGKLFRQVEHNMRQQYVPTAETIAKGADY